MSQVVRALGVFTNARRGEEPECHSRGDRVLPARGRWYIATREQIDLGPYDTKDEAGAVATLLAKVLKHVDDPRVVLAIIAKFQRSRSPADAVVSDGSSTR